MSDIHRRVTGSELQDRLLAERARIHAEWKTSCEIPTPMGVRTYTSLQLPRVKMQPEKSLRERLAEARKFRGQISETQLHSILNAIYESARDRGETVDDAPVMEEPPEIVDLNMPIIQIQTVVAEHFNLTRAQMLSRQRVKRVIMPRQIAMYLTRKVVPYYRGSSGSLDYIGIRFGGRDHTTVSHAIKKIERMVTADAIFAEEIEMLRGIVKP